mmetsp:Transcript_29723/g.76882  ORF Transcript_29723/g.76882 Transcript_29723/m.76882 type:complete len:227 (+) Transcript_29723:66-746(+)
MQARPPEEEEDRPILLNAMKASAVALSNIASAAANAAAQAVDVTLRPVEQEAAAMRHQKQLEQEARIPPWMTLGEQFAILEEELKVRIMRISESEQAFSEEIAWQHTAFHKGDILPGALPQANAALEADARLQALRFRLVPARIKEEAFWRCYFFHVATVKLDLLQDWRTANSTRRTAAMEDEAVLAPDASDEANAETVSQTSAVPDDSVDLDAEFERLVGSPGGL